MLIKKLQLKLLRCVSQNLNNQMWNKRFQNKVKKILGIDVGFGSYGYMNMPCGTKIGNYCSIAGGVVFLAGNHPMDHVSTAACFYNPALGFVSKKYDIQRKSLEIGHDVWIGQNVLITNGCTNIGNGSVIGAGSVVTHDVEPYTIVAGNPARVLRKRFTDEEIVLLEDSKWYLMNINELMPYLDFMNKPEEFYKQIKEKK